MKSYLSMIPISAKVHKRQNAMTIWCIVIAVFLVTAVFSMTEMAVRQETARLVAKHGAEEVTSIFTSEAFRSLLPIAALLFLFVLCAGIFMIAGSMNSNVAQRTQLFGMLRCIGMSKKQVIRYVRLEALNWCKSAIPIGLASGTVATWVLCAVLKYAVGGEWADMPQLKVSILGIVSGAAVGILTVLIAAGKPARRAAKVTPLSALSGISEENNSCVIKTVKNIKIEKVLGIRHAVQSKKNLFLMIGSFALSIILFLSFSVIIDLVNCMMPQSSAAADIEIYAEDGGWIENRLLAETENSDSVERAFGRRAVFDVEADCDAVSSVKCVDIISLCEFDLEALKKDGLLDRNCELDNVISGDAALVITDEAIQKGSTVSAFGTQLAIAEKLKYDPFTSDGGTEGRTTLIVSEEAFRDMTGISDYTMLLVRLSNLAEEKDVEALKTLIGDRYKWVDNREYDTHGTYVAFLVCVYSFLVIIALVTVLNIVNSISVSVSAKIKQYGIMRAVGMSKKQLGSMVKAETLTYSCLGCAVGLIIGLLFSRWLYGYLITSHYAYAQWHLPAAELTVIGAFFALSVAAGIRAPVRRLNEMSITETIRMQWRGCTKGRYSVQTQVKMNDKKTVKRCGVIAAVILAVLLPVIGIPLCTLSFDESVPIVSPEDLYEEPRIDLSDTVRKNTKGESVFAISLEDFIDRYNAVYRQRNGSDYLNLENSDNWYRYSELSPCFGYESVRNQFTADKTVWPMPTISFYTEDQKEIFEIRMTFDDHGYQERFHELFKELCICMEKMMISELMEEEADVMFEKLYSEASANFFGNHAAYGDLERPPLTAVTVCDRIGMYCFYGAGNIEICFIPLTENAVSILKAENTAFDDFGEIGIIQ